jgi:hypothetical protein
MVTLAICIAVFFSGIGGYRVVVSLIVFFAVKSLIKIVNNNTQTIEMIYLPLILVSIYFDLKYGQIYKSYENSSPIIAVLLVVFIDIAINNTIKQMIEYVSEGKIFSVCPKCSFEMVGLETRCYECNYTRASAQSLDNALNTPCAKSDWRFNVENVIGLEDGEKIDKQINLGVFSAKSVFKDKNRLSLSKAIITNKRFVLLKTKIFGRGGWVYREYVQLDNIKEISIANQFYINKKIPTIDIVTTDGVHYELFFVYFFSASSKLMNIVMAIAHYNADIKITDEHNVL